LLAILGVGIAIAMVIVGNRTAPVAQNGVQPASAPFASYIYGSGIVEASTENIAIGTVSGTPKIFVQIGGNVKPGDPLFSIDDRSLRAEAAVVKLRSKLLKRSRRRQIRVRTGTLAASHIAKADELEKSRFVTRKAEAQLKGRADLKPPKPN
jgi:multidrug efflux pump subunit AcrA (membrane-fusion protein)